MLQISIEMYGFSIENGTKIAHFHNHPQQQGLPFVGTYLPGGEGQRYICVDEDLHRCRVKVEVQVVKFPGLVPVPSLRDEALQTQAIFQRHRKSCKWGVSCVGRWPSGGGGASRY